MSDLQALGNLLDQFGGTNDASRRQAEKTYNDAVQKDPNAVARGLVSLTAEGTQTQAMTAAVLLRTLCAVTNENWSKTNAETRTIVKNTLLQAFTKVNNQALRHSIAHVIAQLAVTEENSWPDLMPLVYQTCSSDDVALQSAGFFVLSKLTENLGETMKNQGSQLVNVFQQGLQNASPKVQMHVTKAICSLLCIVQDKNEQQQWSSLLQPVLRAFSIVLQSGDEDDAQQVLQSIIDVARTQPGLFRSQLDGIGTAMVTVSQSSSLPASLRVTSLEVVVTLAEANAAMVRKVGGQSFVRGGLELMLTLMTEIEDDDTEAWCRGAYTTGEDTSGDAESDAVSRAAEDALARFAHSIGGGAVARDSVQMIIAMANTGDSSEAWKRKRAALTAFGIVAESCAKELRPELDQVVEFTLPYIEDEHPRVRHAALGAVALFSDAFGKKFAFQKRYGDRVLPLLANVMRHDVQTVPRIAAHASAALINFCAPTVSGPANEQEDTYCPATVINAHIQSIFGALITVLQCNEPTVLSQALSAVATAAKTAKSHFKTYYDSFMPGVKAIVSNPPKSSNQNDASQLSVVRGKAMECAALMGQAVGKAKFASDAQELLNVLLREQQSVPSDADSNDTSAGYLVETLTRISKVLKEDFVPYLAIVIPPLIHSACRDVDFATEDVDASNPASQPDTIDSITVEIKGVGLKRIMMNTSAYEEKLRAIKLLLEYATEMGAHFAPYAEQVAEVIIPLIPYKFNADIRSTASFLLPQLVGSLLSAARAQFKQQGGNITTTRLPNEMLTPAARVLEKGLPLLLETLQKEHDEDARVGEAESVSDTLLACLIGGSNEDPTADAFTAEATPVFVLPITMVPGIVSVLIEVAKHSLNRRLESLNQLKSDDDADEAAYEALEASLENEEDLSRNIVDGIGYLLKAHRADALPIFDSYIAPFFGKLLANDAPPSLQFNAVCTFDDVIEWCGAGSEPHARTLLPTLFRTLTEEDEMLRQASIYALGQTAERFPNLLTSADAGNAAIRGLVRVMCSPDAKEEENINATENAISALIRLLRNVSPIAAEGSQLRTHTESLFKMCIQQMPLKEDELEARYCHGLLVDALVEGNTTILGSEYAQAAKAISVLAEAIKYMKEASQPDEDDDEEIGLDVELLSKQSGEKFRQWLAAASNGTCNIPANTIQQIWQTLDTEAKDTLQVFASS